MERVSWPHLPLRSVVVTNNNYEKYVMLCNLTVTRISKFKRLGHAQYNVLDLKKKKKRHCGDFVLRFLLNLRE